MTATLKYPASEITPHGWYMLQKGDHPTMWLDAYDGSIRFDLMGGYAIPDRVAAPECVQIPRGGLTGLIPPWKHIDQKGATEDGITNIDSLYDPIEVGLKVMCRGRNGKYVQRVVRDLIASIDAKQQSPLNFITHDMGHWWAPIRWFQGAPPNPFVGAQMRRQDLALRLRADSGFWRTYDDTAVLSGSGFFKRVNIGDQPMYDDYVCFGPFTALRIWDGPGSSDFVEFGPLLANQAALLRTDPRDRNVYDLASVPAAPPSPEEASIFQSALNGLLSFAPAGNTNPLLQTIQSIFGIFSGAPAPVPPQGNFYSLLKGRFSDHSAIPPKSPGNPAVPYYVKVEITGGNADTMVYAGGTPLRRYPL